MRHVLAVVSFLITVTGLVAESVDPDCASSGTCGNSLLQAASKVGKSLAADTASDADEIMHEAQNGIQAVSLSQTESTVEKGAVVSDDMMEEDKPKPTEVDELIKEEIKFDHELEELEVEIPPEKMKPYSALDLDVMANMHKLPPQDESNAIGGYIFDTDGERNPNQRCFIRNQGADKTKMPDNIENSVVDAQEQLNQDGTNRAQWAKCLPPPMYTLLSVESFMEGDIYNGRYEKRMKPATDFYATLKWLHNEACSHVRLRLVHPDMLERIRKEVNFREGIGIGKQIRDEVIKIVKIIVDQHRSRDPKLNAANAKVYQLLRQAVPPMQKAIRVAEHADFATVESGYGRRRNDAKPSAWEMLGAIKNDIMSFDIDALESFLDNRPQPLDDYLTGTAARGAGEPVIGSDAIPDSLRNFGRCGTPLFDFAGYTLWTISLSLDKKGALTVLSRDGWVNADVITSKSATHPIKNLLPADAYEVETKLTTYQDDLFAQGNLACGNRADGLWTLTSYDRNSNTNQVTATQEEGYFCIWMLNDLLHLPENQRAGFSNTEFVAESPEEMARVMNGDTKNYRRYFPAPGEKYKYYHCHYAPRNSGSARVHSFQHQAERHYPGGIRQYCNCDWRRMAMLVSRCDCTLDATGNGGCRRVEMEMLNEHTQVDLWRKDGKKDVPSRVVMVHGALAEGKITSYTYQNNRRRRQPDNKNIYQEDTGRVRPTTDGNGGNNVVCSVNEAGVPENSARTFQRNKNLQALSDKDPYAGQYLSAGQTCTVDSQDQHFGGQRQCGPNLYCRVTNRNNPTQGVCQGRSENAEERLKRTFFADMNGNGIVDYPGCRRRRNVGGRKSPCGNNGNDFPIRDIHSPSRVASPAGGVNLEFEEEAAGRACDALNMKKNCKPADAGWRRGSQLIKYLAKFCDTPASLYQVPVVNGKVPEDEFGAVTWPMPICDPWKGKNCTNYRAKARADFGSHGKGSYLQCQARTCREGTPPSAAQGTFNQNVDKYVYSKSPSDAYARPWYPMIGGSKEGTKPSGVPTKWTQKGSLASGIFNQDILTNHWTSSNPGAKYAKARVEADGTRLDGVTCLNGKYVYARKMPGNKRPVVSTVREAFNRNGPVANGQWACRYLGVHCNANNCNNNGNGEVAGPFVLPKIVTTTTTPFPR